jgi:AraC-like DNA-binding protein
MRQRIFVPIGSGSRTWPPPDAATSAFHQAEPLAPLRRHLRAVRWGHEAIAEPVEERILPDGAIHIVIVVPEERSVRPHAVVVGASTRATVVQLQGTIHHVSFELEAGGAMALLGIPAGELEGCAFALEDLWGACATRLSDALCDARERDESLARVAQTFVMRGHVAEAAVAPPLVRASLARMRSRRGALMVRELARDVGVSERRLEQLFRLHVGMSPKAACRLARFHRVVSRFSDTSGARCATWADVALDAGYADQSHLANDVRAISGLSPTALLAASGFGFLQDGVALAT